MLSSRPAHGYAIISALRDRSGGTFDLPEGTIYPALHRLEDSGLLASTRAQLTRRDQVTLTAGLLRRRPWNRRRPIASSG